MRFERLVLDTSECDLDGFWCTSEQPLCEVHASPYGTIEDSGSGVLQLDFANAWVGGGVLGNGSVQEEIRFLICPELIVSRLLCERMEANEAILLQGFERLSHYRGYARSFECAEPYADEPEPSRRPALVAIDAVKHHHSDPLRQFKPSELERELSKALAGFTPPPDHASDNPFAPAGEAAARGYATMPLCTGNWGCGAFGGDLQLKALIQLLAASASGRSGMHYLTFGDEELAAGLNGLASRMRTLGWTCGHLATSLRGFRPWKHPHAAEKQGTVGLYADVFGFLHARLDCTHEQQMQMQMQMQIHTQQQMQQPGGKGDAEAAPTPASGTSPPPTAASLAASHSPPLDGTPLTRTLEEASAPQLQRPPEEDDEEERLEQQPATPAAAAAPPVD